MSNVILPFPYTPTVEAWNTVLRLTAERERADTELYRARMAGEGVEEARERWDEARLRLRAAHFHHSSLTLGVV